MLRKILLVLSLIMFVWNARVLAEDPVGATSIHVQCEVDNEGNLHMVYMSADWGYVYYMKYDGSTWIGPHELPDSYPCWPPFTNPSIAVGPDGRAQIVYGIRTDDWPNDVDYFNYARANDPDGTSFTYEQIGNDNYRRQRAEIAVDENNEPHISFERTLKNDSPHWDMTYRRPDGEERVIAHYGSSGYQGRNPCIAVKGGTVHMAWYVGGLDTGKHDIEYATGTPYGSFSHWQVTNVPEGDYCFPPKIEVAPDGHVEIVYHTADLSGSSAYYNGLWVTDPYAGTTLLEGEWVLIWPPEPEDPQPEIDFDSYGNRRVVWSHNNTGEAYYKFNDDAKVPLSIHGKIDVGASYGASTAYYTRVLGNEDHWPLGPIYFGSIGGAPPNQSPVALFDVIPTSGDINTVFNFDASASYDPDGNYPLTYRWDWESDGVLDVEGQDADTPSHAFSRPDTYHVTLEVVDALGASGFATADVEVFNHPPEASFQAISMGPFAVLFDASASFDFEDSTDLRYSWDWTGTGLFTRPTAEDSVLHEYDETGVYEVTLRVKDQVGAIDDTTMTIEVGPPAPPTSFEASDYPDDQGGAIQLSWELSSDDTLRATVTAYFIHRQVVGESQFVEFSVPAGTSSYVDSVAAGTFFNYSIAAFDGVSYSEWVEVPDSVAAVDNIPPEPATDLAATIATLDEGWAVTLTWTPSTSADVVTQTVYRAQADEPWAGLATLQPTADTHSDTILEAGTYYYRTGTLDFDNISFSDSAVVEAMGGDEATSLPSCLTLAGVSPNPARNAFVIHFAVPSGGTVVVSVHDLAGRRVSEASVVCSRAGWCTHKWEPRDGAGRALPGGVYMMKLSMSGEVATTPVVIIR